VVDAQEQEPGTAGEVHPNRFPQVQWDGAARVLAVLRDLPAEHRMDTMAMACDAFVKIVDRKLWEVGS
jgi:hypothetical protein